MTTDRFLQHIAIEQKLTIFKDTVHIDYDCEIRKLVESIGFVAFGREFTGESVLHYAPQNLKSKKNTFNKDISYKRSSSGKKPCFKFNREGGCDLSEEKCGFAHFCNKCYSKVHSRVSCNKS